MAEDYNFRSLLHVEGRNLAPPEKTIRNKCEKM